MNESSWTHAGILFAFLAVVVPIWWDLRKQGKEGRKELASEMAKNGERLTRIEVMVKPLWDWWNNTNGKS